MLVGVELSVGVGVRVGVQVGGGLLIGVQGIVNESRLEGGAWPVAQLTAALLVTVWQPWFVSEKSAKAMPKVTQAPPPESPKGKTA